MRTLLDKHHGLFTFSLVLVLALGFAAVWIGVTGRFKPPLWVAFLVPAVLGLAGGQLDAVLCRRAVRRAQARKAAHR